MPKFCTCCGNSLNDDQNFCDVCGTSVSSENEVEKSDSDDNITDKVDLSCPKCHGVGSYRESIFGIIKYKCKCSACEGKGVFFRLCPDCGGLGVDQQGIRCQLCKGERKISSKKAENIKDGEDLIKEWTKNPIKSIVFILLNFFVITPILVYIFADLPAIALASALWYPCRLWHIRLDLPLKIVVCIAVSIVSVAWWLLLLGIME